MFICDPCHIKEFQKTAEIHISFSNGPCEICGVNRETCDCRCDRQQSPVLTEKLKTVPNTLVEKKMTAPFMVPPVWDGNARDRLQTNAAKDMIQHYAEYIANSGFRGDPYVRAVNDFAEQLLEIETEAKRQGAAYDGR